MIILLTAIAVMITGVPLAAVLLVTLASRHEDRARSIAAGAPGPLDRAARKLLAFRAVGVGRHACRAVPVSQNRTRAWDAGQPAGDGLEPIGGPVVAGGSSPR